MKSTERRASAERRRELRQRLVARDAFHVVGNWVELDRAHYSSRFTIEAQQVDRMLDRIVTAYHWNRSDPMSDIYNERFHRDVRVTPRDGEWESIEREKLEAAREEKPK